MNRATDPSRRLCPLCASADCEPILQKKDLILVQCRLCLMQYANPIPAEMVSGSFYNAARAPFYLSRDKIEGDYASVRFERELRLFRRFCKTGSVLDVGCSTGAFLYQLKKRFPNDYSVAGTDVSEHALEHARSRGVEIMPGSFLDFDFREKRFDAITFWAVMEHLPDPGIFLKRAASLLKRGGHCFVLVPNIKSLAVRILGKKYRYILPEHVNYFAAQTLRSFAQTETTFEIVGCGATHFNPLVIAQDWRGGGEFVPDGERAALLKRTTRYKKNPLLAPLRWAYRAAENVLAGANLADNLFVVLRKK